MPDPYSAETGFAAAEKIESTLQTVSDQVDAVVGWLPESHAARASLVELRTQVRHALTAADVTSTVFEDEIESARIAAAQEREAAVRELFGRPVRTLDGKSGEVIGPGATNAELARVLFADDTIAELDPGDLSLIPNDEGTSDDDVS